MIKTPPLSFAFFSPTKLLGQYNNQSSIILPPYFIGTQLSPYDSYVTQLHFFSEFETSPPLKLTFYTEFALF